MAQIGKPDADFLIKEHDILSSKSSQYQIESFLGEGTFGKVASCVKLDTKEKIAVKIVRKKLVKCCELEVTMLQTLRKLDLDKNNLVKLNEHFKYRGHICLAFEKLDLSLFDFMKARKFKPLSLSEIRVISQQMLVALNALRRLKVAHTDIKPDNIMLVNHRLHPFKVKLIDFGLAVPVRKLLLRPNIQALGYRAPEVILGLPLNAAVDIWSLGCVLAFVYLGGDLYPTQCKYEVMRVIVKLHGQPDDQMLKDGFKSNLFFTKSKRLHRAWKFNTRSKYMLLTGSHSRRSHGIFDRFNSLDDISKTNSSVMRTTEYEDTQAFISFLKRLLHVNAEKRITPSEGLEYSFISMSHFHSRNRYVISAYLTKRDAALDYKAPVKGDTKTADANKKPPDKDEARHNSDNNKDNSGEVTNVTEVKGPKKWFKRIHQFFSRICCCRVNVKSSDWT